MFKIYSPSYKRADTCKTHKYLSEVTYVVRESEAKDYEGVHDKLWIVPDSAQGNLCRVRNYILDNAPEENILLIDDDIKYFGRWNGNKSTKLHEQEVYDMIQEGFQLAEDLDIHFWGLNCLADKGAFREYTPFGFTKYIGGPFQAHRKNPLRYDEVIYLKEDYDMSLQILNEYRKTLRMNMYHYVCDQATLAGGCAEYRNVAREMEQNDMLQNKWGSKIVRFDTTNKSGKEKTFDINPIIKVPIGGV
jgi:glycosyltransferase involved in cell wall biosynthesis